MNGTGPGSDSHAPGMVLCLDDFRDSLVTGPFMERAKQLGGETFAAKLERNAVLGISGVRKVLLNAYNTVAAEALRAFESEEAAKEYLVQQRIGGHPPALLARCAGQRTLNGSRRSPIFAVYIHKEVS